MSFFKKTVNNEIKKMERGESIISRKDDDAARAADVIKQLSGADKQTNKKLIDNFGTLNMNNVEYYVTGNSRSTYSYDIYNEDGGFVDINNSNFSGYHGYAIHNESSDTTQETTTIKAVTIKNTNISGGTISKNAEYKVVNRIGK